MDDTMVQFRTCLSSEVSGKSIINGSVILCSDSGEIYYDNLNGERILIARSIEYLANDTERTNLLTPESNILYIVRSTGGIWIYSSGWVRLNADATAYFDIDNVEIPTDGTTISDERVTSSCTAEFSSIPALYDLATADGVSITCTCSDGSIAITSTCQYTLIGKIKVTKA